MYNSDFRIYTVDQVEQILTNTFEDLEFTVYIDEGEQEKMISIKYPYFHKPKYVMFDAILDSED